MRILCFSFPNKRDLPSLSMEILFRFLYFKMKTPSIGLELFSLSFSLLTNRLSIEEKHFEERVILRLVCHCAEAIETSILVFVIFSLLREDGCCFLTFEK